MPVGIGIDIGAHSIKVVQARVDKGRVSVVGALRMEHGLTASSKGGPVDLPPALAAEVQRAKLTGAGVLGISGRDLILRYAVVPPAPPWRMKEIMKFEVDPGNVGEAGELCSDYRILALPGSGLSDQVVTLVAVAKTPQVTGLFDQIRAAKLSARHCTPSSIALYQAYRRSGQYNEDETVFLMDVGHDKVELAISAVGELVFARSMPGGGRKFTDAINGLFKAGPAKAEDFKHHRASLPAAPPSDRQALAMYNALRTVADQLVSGVNNGVRFCQTQTKIRKLEMDRVVVSGGGAKLKGFVEYLSKRLGRPVETLDLASGVEIGPAAAAAFEGDGSEMAVALGLAVCDGDPNALSMELVPEAVQKRRRFVQKTVFAYAAALVTILLAGAMYTNASQNAQAAGAVTKLLKTDNGKLKPGQEQVEKGMSLPELSKRHAAYEETVRQNESLRSQHEMLRRETRFGLAVLKLLSHLRQVTPQGMHLTGLAPAQKDIDTIRDQFTLKITGKADTKLIPEVYDALKAFVVELKKFEIVRDAASKVEQPKPVARKKNQAPSSTKAFSIVVELESGIEEEFDEEAGP